VVPQESSRMMSLTRAITSGRTGCKTLRANFGNKLST
jgi:hypothetical protein